MICRGVGHSSNATKRNRDMRDIPAVITIIVVCLFAALVLVHMSNVAERKQRFIECVEANSMKTQECMKLEQ